MVNEIAIQQMVMERATQHNGDIFFGFMLIALLSLAFLANTYNK